VQATVANTNKSGSCVEDEDIVQEAEQHAAEGGSESDGNLKGDTEHESNQSYGTMEVSSQCSFAALSCRFEAAADSDKNEDPDDDNLDPALAGTGVSAPPCVCFDHLYFNLTSNNCLIGENLFRSDESNQNCRHVQLVH
jgi:hypothetical protein